MVFVTIEDVNDNAPEFDKTDYSVSLLENSPDDAVLFRVAVTDLDQVDVASKLRTKCHRKYQITSNFTILLFPVVPQGGFVGTFHILPETAPFAIDSDGTIRVTNSTALDREATETIVFQVKWILYCLKEGSHKFTCTMKSTLMVATVHKRVNVCISLLREKQTLVSRSEHAVSINIWCCLSITRLRQGRQILPTMLQLHKSL